MTPALSTIEQALDALARGEIIIVTDAEDRENEGDFICAAEKVTPEMVNFMITHGRGQLCMPILPDLAHQLELAPMVQENTAPLGTNFTVPVDHVSARTGITAGERAHTIQAIIDPATKPTDLARPGHLFPLIAKEGGVLRRAGHTEAAVDLMKLAGLKPAGVLIEILDDNGDRAGSDRLTGLATKFGLPMISIEELIRYRRRAENLVYRKAEADLPTKYGMGRIIVYGVKYESQEPVAIVLGDVSGDGEPAGKTASLVRLHSSCFTGDLVGSLRCDCGDQLHMAMERMQHEGRGVLVYLPQEGRGIGLAEKIRAYALQEQGFDTIDANIALGHAADSRDYCIGIQILKDLALRNVRLLTNNPKKTDALIYGGFDLNVVEQIPICGPVNPYNAHYLATKRDRMGHTLPVDEG